ncbi:Hypothetical protein SynRCC307_1944 [Synechococcus sp. RCC307]|nr:Hypothetical protein SynRCC307_1944 [Synechococcus sp. RCC307]
MRASGLPVAVEILLLERQLLRDVFKISWRLHHGRVFRYEQFSINVRQRGFAVALSFLVENPQVVSKLRHHVTAHQPIHEVNELLMDVGIVHGCCSSSCVALL